MSEGRTGAMLAGGAIVSLAVTAVVTTALLLHSGGSDHTDRDRCDEYLGHWIGHQGEDSTIHVDLGPGQSAVIGDDGVCIVGPVKEVSG